MTTPDISYTPGEWLAVIGPRIWALIDVKVDDPRVRALWQASEAGIEELLDVLLRDGLRSLAGLVVVAEEAGDLRYAVRRPGVLSTEGSGETLTIDGSSRDPWEGGRLLTMPRRMVLRSDGEPAGVDLPTAAGVASASRLLVDFEPPATARSPAAHTETFVEAEHVAMAVPPARADSELTREGAAEPDLEAELGPVDSQASTYFQLLNSSTTDRDALLSTLSGDETGDEPTRETPPAKATSDATSDWKGDLDDHQPARISEAPATTEAPTTAEASATTEDPATTEARATTTPGELIDGVPWARGDAPGRGAERQPPAARFTQPTTSARLPASPPAGPPSTRPDPDSSAGEVDSMSVTISRAALRRQLEAEMAQGPMLPALLCKLGHLSPPYAAICRVCGGELADQVPVEAVRPALGQLVLSNGGSVLLDKGVIFGRSPQSDIEDAAQRPNLVRLIDSPEISRRHASVMLDGWQVLLRDLGSQNGTILTLPGRQPEQIRPHEDYVLEPGSVVSFADVVSCKFEVTT